jgi:hypothetical protein
MLKLVMAGIATIGTRLVEGTWTSAEETPRKKRAAPPPLGFMAWAAPRVQAPVSRPAAAPRSLHRCRGRRP